MTPVILALATKARNAGVASATASTSELVAEMPGERVAEAVAAGFVAAGPALTAPAGATIHDLPGATLMPGLIDPHVHPMQAAERACINTLEQALDFIEDDELVEVTPQGIRIRKRHLTENDRKRAGRN